MNDEVWEEARRHSNKRKNNPSFEDYSDWQTFITRRWKNIQHALHTVLYPFRVAKQFVRRGIGRVDWRIVTTETTIYVGEAILEGVLVTFPLNVFFGVGFTPINILAAGVAVKQAKSYTRWLLKHYGELTKRVERKKNDNE
jgi:hypothetical protein